jgi:hypothetical protein
MCENIYNIQINTLAIYVEKIDETLRIGACNIHVQPLQHVQHPDLLLQHTSETSETLETDACNMYFSPFFRTMQRRAGHDRFLPAGSREWWCGLVAASCARA